MAVDLLEQAMNSIINTFNSLLPGLVLMTLIFIVLLIIYLILNKIIVVAVHNASQHKESTYSIMKIFKYFYWFIGAIIIAFSFSGSIVATGVSLGLFSAALGWALQKPITGIAAWILITLKRPFSIGDRVIIDNVRGDIVDISLFYIYVDECGGTVESDEKSGREILFPTSILFDKTIINYTKTDNYILDQVLSEFTFESNMDIGEKIIIDAAKKFTTAKKQGYPATRLEFRASGVEFAVRYFVRAKHRAQVKTDITREIFKQIAKTKGIEFAYPHMEILMPKKSSK